MDNVVWHCARLPKRKKVNYGLRAFLLGLLVSAVIYVPFMVYDKGLFLYYGDFNVQQISFYQLIHDTILSGNIGWSNKTDLGANIIGSYSFYIMGSPFFWLTLLFPSKAVPYLIGPLLIIKTACMSWSAYIYLRRYVYDRNFAVLGGLLYAFSGFTCFNIFFNHFHEPMIIFPLLLSAIDELFENNRKGVTALCVFAACIINYYFFVGQVVFIVIYWLVRVCSQSYKIKWKNMAALLFESIVGLGMAMLLLLPTILCVTQNSRLSYFLNGWNGLVYNSSQRYINILTAFLFPPELPAFPTFTPDANNKWGSLSGWLPLFGLCGVVAFLTKKGGHWLKKLIPILMFTAFIPLLNSMFQIFNAQYYARWMYMMVLMFVLATCISLEDSRIKWSYAIGVVSFLTLFIGGAIAFMPKYTQDADGIKTYKFGLMSSRRIFFIHCGIAVLSLIFLIVVIAIFRKKKRLLSIVSIVMVCIISSGYTVYIIGMGKIHGYDSQEYMNALVINHKEDIHLPNSENVRTDFYKMMDNSAMFWQLPTIQTFHSVVPGSVMKFFNSIGVTRDVGSRPDVGEYAVRSLLSVKWLIDYTEDDEAFSSKNGVTQMPGWKYYDKQSKFDIWENEYYIPMGFCYENYISEKDYKECEKYNRSKLMLRAMVLTNEQIKKYSFTKDKLITAQKMSYIKAEYFENCQRRQKMSCKSFQYDKSSFTAVIDRKGQKENTLLFFSVPYESGWTAEVNGKPVEIEKVNVGFMAVEVPSDTVSTITFTYHTPGLVQGIGITIIFTVLYLLYLLCVRIYCIKTGTKPLTRKRKFRIVKKRELSLTERAKRKAEAENGDKE